MVNVVYFVTSLICFIPIQFVNCQHYVESGASCPKYPNGKCTYEEDCPAFSRHGICGADKNYKALLCCTSSATITVLNYYTAREFPERTQCGQSRNLNQIFGGVTTEIGEYPWMTALLYIASKTTTYGGVKCGGTLITEKFVLTAAHCLTNQTAKSIRVLLGDWNITSDPDPYPAAQCKTSNCTAKIEYADKVINATVDEIISHELYNTKTKRNDIALLRLKTPVQFTDYVRPICLPSRDFPDLTSEVEVVVAGWGITEKNSQSDILLKATLHVLTNNNCLEKIQKNDGIHKTEFCAAHVDSDACGGDSGGPLMSSYKDYRSNWFQLGIVESGGSCSSFGATATVYTRVSSFVDWIIEQIAPQSEKHSPCITPDNEYESCVLVNECPVLEQQYLRPENSSEVEFIRRSLCGIHLADRSDMVCCRWSQTKRENAMEGSSCVTPRPESKDGRCVRITNCPALKDASKAAREHIQKYQCGFDDELLVCCKTQDIVVASEPKYLEEFSSANIPNRTICGRVSNNTKSENPWLAAVMVLKQKYVLICAGSLINKRFVLTSAYCFEGEPILKNYRVLLGTENAYCQETSDCPSSMQNLTVERAIPHPFYYKWYSLNNIALVRLGSDVVFNDFVSPVCLPPANLKPLRRGSEVIVATWGGKKEYRIGNALVYSNVHLWDSQSCIENPDPRTMHKQELCIPTHETMELCTEEWGGSIVRAYTDQLGQNSFLEGIYLGSNNCRNTDYLKNGAAYHVRISAYTSWIVRTITETT